MVALKPDAAHVLTPPNAHFAVAKPLLAAGIDLLLEKPMCDRSADARSLIAQAGEAGVLLGTGHNFLLYPIWDKLRAAVDGGAVGALRSIDVCYRRPFPPLRANNTQPWAMRGSRNISSRSPCTRSRARSTWCRRSTWEHVTTSRPQDRPTASASSGSGTFRQTGDVSVRFDLSFEDAYSESFVHVRGSIGFWWCSTSSTTASWSTPDHSRRNTSNWPSRACTRRVPHARGAVGTLLETMAGKVGSKKSGAPMSRASTGRWPSSTPTGSDGCSTGAWVPIWLCA